MLPSSRPAPTRRRTSRWMIAGAMATLGGVAVGALVGVFLTEPELLRRPAQPTKLLRQNPQLLVEEDSEAGARERPPPLQPPPAPFDYQFPAVVEKKAVSSKMRILFLVGLEGTGHHYLADVLDDMCKHASMPCPKVCPIGRTLYQGLSIPKSAVDYEAARQRLRTEMEILATHERENVPDGSATMAGFGNCRFEIGMMSYPNFNGADKTLQYVDFRLLAEEAERAGVDVRFIYLNRSAESILISNTQHNNYGGSFMQESRVLLNNAAVVESIFQELGPGFTTCFRYEDMEDPAQAARVARFAAPNDYIAEHLSRNMLYKVKIRSPPPQQQQPHRLSEIDLRYRQREHRNDWRYDPRKTNFRVRVDSREAAAAAAAAAAGRKSELGMRHPSMDIVVARLQQKLDKIERDVCTTGDDSNNPA